MVDGWVSWLKLMGWLVHWWEAELDGRWVFGGRWVG